jgi:hypothetical protein
MGHARDAVEKFDKAFVDLDFVGQRRPLGVDHPPGAACALGYAVQLNRTRTSLLEAQAEPLAYQHAAHEEHAVERLQKCAGYSVSCDPVPTSVCRPRSRSWVSFGPW